jgi:hypothetical protein
MKIGVAAVLFIAPLIGHCADKVQVVDPDRLAKYWLLSATDGAQVPNTGGRNLDLPSCATVSYVIEKNGTTSHIKLEKTEPDGDLGKVAVSVVKGLAYTAAGANIAKDAVYTYITMPFNLPDATSTKPEDKAQRARVLAACKLDDFKAPATGLQP